MTRADELPGNSGVSPESNPDAALIAAATAFLAIDRKIQAWNRGEIGLPEEESDATVLAWAEHLDRITPMPATSLEGLKAKAAVLKAAIYDIVRHFTADTVEGSGRPHELLAYSLCDDLLGRGLS